MNVCILEDLNFPRCSHGSDGCVREGGGVGSRQHGLQENLSGAAPLHPGRAADGFWLSTHTHTHAVRSRTHTQLSPGTHASAGGGSHPDRWVDDEGPPPLGELLHPLDHAAKGERAAWNALVPEACFISSKINYI